VWCYAASYAGKASTGDEAAGASSEVNKEVKAEGPSCKLITSPARAKIKGEHCRGGVEGENPAGGVARIKGPGRKRG